MFSYTNEKMWTVSARTAALVDEMPKIYVIPEWIVVVAVVVVVFSHIFLVLHIYLSFVATSSLLFYFLTYELKLVSVSTRLVVYAMCA